MDGAFLLVFSGLALGLVGLLLWVHPGREPKVAGLAGLVLNLGLTGTRLFVHDPLPWGIPLYARSVQLSMFCLSTLMLILVGLAYREVREGAHLPLLKAILISPLVVLLVGGFLYLDARLKSRLEFFLADLPYQLALAALAFLGPILLFELLWRLPLWQRRSNRSN